MLQGRLCHENSPSCHRDEAYYPRAILLLLFSFSNLDFATLSLDRRLRNPRVNSGTKVKRRSEMAFLVACGPGDIFRATFRVIVFPALIRQLCLIDFCTFHSLRNLPPRNENRMKKRNNPLDFRELSVVSSAIKFPSFPSTAQFSSLDIKRR